MIINNSHQFIFVHIPKAAGTSVTTVLSQFTNYCDLEIGGTTFGEKIQSAYRERFGIGKHSPAARIKRVTGDVTWSKMFSFSFVRNPFSRCLSTYHFLKKWESPNQKFTEQIRAFTSFDDYVLSDIWDESSGPDDIFRPQCHWLRDENPSGQLIVDFVGKVEQIDADLLHCLNVIGVRKAATAFSMMPKLNTSEPHSLDSLQNKDVVEKIVKKYKVDFEAFSYPVEIQPSIQPAAEKD